MHPIMIMTGAAFLWSLYPALIAISAGSIGPVAFVLLVHIFCGLSAFLLAWVKIRQRRETFKRIWTEARSLGVDQWIFLGVVGLVSTLYNFCFVLAMNMTSKIGAAIIIEAWPIIAMFLSPILITKNWTRVRMTDYIAGVLALIGVVMIMGGGEAGTVGGDSWMRRVFGGDDIVSMIGAFVALIGSISLALSIIFRAEISNRLAQMLSSSGKFDLRCSFLGETVCRIAALPSTLLLLLIFPEDTYLSWSGVGYAMIAGVLIFNIGSVAITLALLRAPSPTINMLYYISPVLAVLWLYLMGQSGMTVSVIFGGVLVILANLMVIAFARRSEDKQRAV